MPFKSEAQRRKFYAMAERGEISKSKVKEWEKETGKKKLPEKVGMSRKSAKKKLAEMAAKIYERERRKK